MLHYVTAVSHPATKIGSGSVTGNLPDALKILFNDETEILTPEGLECNRPPYYPFSGACSFRRKSTDACITEKNSPWFQT